MREYPEVLAAAKRSEWAIADALFSEIGPRGSAGRFDECAAYLKENGIQYSANYLAELHAAARKFPRQARAGWLTPRLAISAGSPATLERAIEVKKEQIKAERAAGWDAEFTPPTKRQIMAVRKAENHHRAQADGKARDTNGRARPKPDASRVDYNRPVSETQRTIDYLKVVGHAEQATASGVKFIEALAGQELKPQEATDLAEFVQEALDTWKIAFNAVRNPLAKSVERFLEEVSE